MHLGFDQKQKYTRLRLLEMYKKLVLLVLVFSLTGCYRTWQQIDVFAKGIKCTDSQASLTKMAKAAKANVFFDTESQSLQIQKESDTVVIQFDKSETITRVSVFKVKLQLFGIHRLQMAPEVVLDCTKKASDT